MAKFISILVLVVVLVVGLNIYLGLNKDKLVESSNNGLSDRITLLEEQLKNEVEKRQELQFIVSQLSGGMDENFEDDENLVDVEEDVVERETETLPQTQEQRREAYIQRMQARNDSSRRVTRLEESGFAPDEAAWIVQREKEIQAEQLSSMWDERHQEYLENPKAFDLATDNPIRAELGDQAYEKYLTANGRATSVRVNQILENSPATYAGLQAGDEILRYGGQRVFNFSELNTVTVQGDRGTPVIVEVLRNGSTVQLTIDRGPLGISGRRGRRGF